MINRKHPSSCTHPFYIALFLLPWWLIATLIVQCLFIHTVPRFVYMDCALAKKLLVSKITIQAWSEILSVVGICYFFQESPFKVNTREGLRERFLQKREGLNYSIRVNCLLSMPECKYSMMYYTVQPVVSTPESIERIETHWTGTICTVDCTLKSTCILAYILCKVFLFYPSSHLPLFWWQLCPSPSQVFAVNCRYPITCMNHGGCTYLYSYLQKHTYTSYNIFLSCSSYSGMATLPPPFYSL